MQEKRENTTSIDNRVSKYGVQNGRKGVDLSHAIGKCLINGVSV